MTNFAEQHYFYLFIFSRKELLASLSQNWNQVLNNCAESSAKQGPWHDPRDSSNQNMAHIITNKARLAYTVWQMVEFGEGNAKTN